MTQCQLWEMTSKKLFDKKRIPNTRREYSLGKCFYLGDKGNNRTTVWMVAAENRMKRKDQSLSVCICARVINRDKNDKNQTCSLSYHLSLWCTFFGFENPPENTLATRERCVWAGFTYEICLPVHILLEMSQVFPSMCVQTDKAWSIWDISQI